MKDLKLSRPLTLERYEERSKLVRFKEGLARLIAPMLWYLLLKIEVVRFIEEII